MEIPTYSIAAYSGTGKTTLLEKLIPELKSRGLRVAVIKHDAHDFDIDHKGKDSWRMTRAGADVTIVSSDKKAAVMENRPVSAEWLVSQIRDVDIILTEGYKHGRWRKIALYRSASGKEPACDLNECFAVMSDVPVESVAPCFDINDIRGLADFIIADIESQSAESAGRT